MTDRSERTKRLGRQQEREIAPGDEAPPGTPGTGETCARTAAAEVAATAESAAPVWAEAA